MNELFKLEGRKVLKGKSLYIFLIIVALLPILYELLNYFMYLMVVGTAGEDAILLSDFIEAYGLSGTGSLLGAVSGGDVTLCVSLFTTIYFCTDYSEGTMRNVLSKGYSRFEVFTVKYVISMAVALGYLLVSQIVAFITGSVLWGVGTFKAKYLFALFVQAVNLFASVSFAILFATIVKKMGGSICSVLFIPLGIEVILSIADVFVISDNAKFYPSYLWTDNSYAYLIDPTTSVTTIAIFMIVGLVSLIAFTGLSILTTRKAEY